MDNKTMILEKVVGIAESVIANSINVENDISIRERNSIISLLNTVENLVNPPIDSLLMKRVKSLEKGSIYDNKDEYIYFILDKANNALKIGYSSNPKARFKSLSTANPNNLILLGVIEGDIHLEKKLHNKFSHLNIKLEWFKYDNELKEYAASALKNKNNHHGRI